MDIPAYLLGPHYELPFAREIEENPVVWKFEFSGILPLSEWKPHMQTNTTRLITAGDGFAVYNRVDNSNETYKFWECACGRKTIFSPCYCGKQKPK